MILNNSKPCEPVVDSHLYCTVVMDTKADVPTSIVVKPRANSIPFDQYSIENLQRAGIPLRPLDMNPVTRGDAVDAVESIANQFSQPSEQSK